MSTSKIANHIGNAFDEWVKAVTRSPKDMREVMALVDSGELETINFLPTKLPNDLITPLGKKELIDAVHLGLHQTQMTEKLTYATAFSSLVEIWCEEIEEGKRTRTFDEDKVATKFLESLEGKRYPKRTYCIPVVFSQAATKTNFCLGPVRLQSTKIFSEDYERRKILFRENTQVDWHHAAEECWDHIATFDHVLLIDVENFEDEMAWRAAKDIAEAFLNLIRIFYGFHNTREIKAFDGNLKQTKGAKLVLSNDIGLSISLSRDWMGAHIDDEHVSHFVNEFSKQEGFFASYLFFLLSNEQMNSPIRSRLRQANSLIAQAYSEPHLDMKLVRTVSALEKLAGVTGKNKWLAIADRCASACVSEENRKKIGIYHAVRGAYRCRNAIVHDETPPLRHLSNAFLRLDHHLLEIFIGFIYLYADLTLDNGITTPKHLRKAIDDRLKPWR